MGVFRHIVFVWTGLVCEERWGRYVVDTYISLPYEGLLFSCDSYLVCRSLKGTVHDFW